MNRNVIWIGSLLLASAISGPAVAGDAGAGKAKASTVCAACHGPTGMSTNPLWPNLAGQHEPYLAKAIKDYRDGARQDPVMTPMAAGLSDKDIEDLAAYFAAQKPAG